MAFTRFSIWDKDVADFLAALDREGFEEQDIVLMRKWFITEAPLLLHKIEHIVFVTDTKEFLEKRKHFPDLTGTGLSGYMFKTLLELQKEFNKKFNCSTLAADADTKAVVNLAYYHFIINACSRHDAFYNFRARLSSVELNEFIKVNSKPNYDAQTSFIQERIADAIAKAGDDPDFKTDLESYLKYIIEVNVAATPGTKSRDILVERSVSGNGLRRYGYTPGNSPNLSTPSPNQPARTLSARATEANSSTAGMGSPLSFVRMMSGMKISSSKENLQVETKPEEEERAMRSPRYLGFKSQ